MKSEGIPALTRLDVCPDRCYQHRRGLKARNRISAAPDAEVGRCGRLTGSLTPVAAGVFFCASGGPMGVIPTAGPGNPCHWEPPTRHRNAYWFRVNRRTDKTFDKRSGRKRIVAVLFTDTNRSRP